MTGNSNKVRAVFLAALMIFSVFAGTVAFSGSVAAQTVDDGSVSNSTVAEQTTNIHEVTVDSSSVDLTAESNVTVSFPGTLDLSSATIPSSSVSASSSTGGTAGSASVSEVNTTSNNVTITIDSGASGTSDALNVSFTAKGVVAPSVSEDTNADVTAFLDNDTQDSTAVDSQSTIETLTIQESSNPELDSAVHYVDSGDEGAGVEIVFTQPVDIPQDSDLVLYEDESQVADYSDATAGGSGSSVQRVFLDSSGEVLTGDLELELTSDITGAGSGAEIADDGNNSVTFAPVTLKDGNGVNAYQGGNVAIVSDSGNNADITVEGDDNSYFFEGSTGANSEVFVFNTSNRELGDYNVSIANGDASTTNITVRNLGFNAEIEDLNVTDDDTIEVDITANAGNRPVEVELLDSSDDDINTTEVTTGGNGEATVEIDTATADEGDALDTGDYTVQSTDLFSGIDVESSTIAVEAADDEEANFASNVISDERGDILEATVEMTQTDTATLSFGSEEDGVIANATIEDEDDDDEVTVYINTYEMSQSGSNNVFNLDSDSDDDIIDQNLDTATDDLIDAGDYDFEVQAGDQGVTGNPVDDSDDVATVTLNERGTQEFRTWTVPDSVGTPSDLEDVSEAIEDGELTQASDISNGDVVVHQLVTTGFEGALDARDNEEVSSGFFGTLKGDSSVYNLTVEEASPGANQDAKSVELNASNTEVVADGPNDTYFIAFNTDDVTYFDSTSIEDDTALEANFTVIANDDSSLPGSSNADFVNEGEFDSDENEETFVEYDVVEPDISVDEPFNVSQASAQTVSGTTTLAPGTELSLRVRSQDGVSPSFLKTASPIVQSDRTFNATFDFSEQNVGDEYDIIVNGGDADEVEEEGQVVESVATATPEPDTATPEPDTATPEPDTATPEPDTATPEPDTDTAMPDTDTPTSTPTSTPGFGMVVALTALLAAALLAIRRD